MKKQILSILTLVGLFISPISCSVFNNLNSNSGTIKMAVKFPENNGFSIKAIPDNTYVIIVQINGVGVDSSSPIFFSLTRNENSRLIRNIPQGDKNIKVLALASNAELLAEGQSNINILTQQLNKVEIELKPIKRDIQPSAIPSVIPSSGCVITVRLNDIPLKLYLEQQLIRAGCKIIVESSSNNPSPSFSPIPTSVTSQSASPLPQPTVTPSQYFGSSSGGNFTSGGDAISTSSPSPSNNLQVTVNVKDGSENTDKVLKAQQYKGE